MKTQYKITFEYFDWLTGKPTLGTLIVQAPNKDFAVKQYYQARGKKNFA